MKNISIITLSDSYKVGHWKMMPDGTTFVYSYDEARNGALYNNVVFAGLQYILEEYLEGVTVSKEKIDWAEKLFKAHFGTDQMFNRKGWEHILNKHGGKLPVRIKAVPEGTPVQVSNVLMTVENTDPECYWLTNYLETLLTHVWYASTVATVSRECKKIFKHYLNQTSDNHGGIDFMLHDFGFRGVSSVESAGVGGFGHLINFKGTDTLRAMEVALFYYGANLDTLAFSVAASEHSVMTARGPGRGEKQVVADLFEKFPVGILSLVVDSFDDTNFVKELLGKEFKDAILAREGMVVARPDSGDPEEVSMKLIKILGDAFGTTINSKGYKVLNPKVKLLWGDGIDIRGIRGILGAAQVNGWAADNFVFGMGGGLLQKVNRDTQRFAFKSSAQERDGVWHDIFKEPKDTTKKSKRGKLGLVHVDAELDITMRLPLPAHLKDALVTVFENGVITKRYTFDEIRKNAEIVERKPVVIDPDSVA